MEHLACMADKPSCTYPNNFLWWFNWCAASNKPFVCIVPFFLTVYGQDISIAINNNPMLCCMHDKLVASLYSEDN